MTPAAAVVTLAAMPNTPEPEPAAAPPAKGKPFFSDPENAKRARQIQAARHAEKRRLLQDLVELALAASSVTDFASVSLVHVREHIARLDGLLAQELKANAPRAAALRDLAHARKALADQERQLAGRPLPGSLRPSTRAPQVQQRAPMLPPE